MLCSKKTLRFLIGGFLLFVVLVLVVVLILLVLLILVSVLVLLILVLILVSVLVVHSRYLRFVLRYSAVVF